MDGKNKYERRRIVQIVEIRLESTEICNVGKILTKSFQNRLNHLKYQKNCVNIEKNSIIEKKCPN